MTLFKSLIAVFGLLVLTACVEKDAMAEEAMMSDGDTMMDDGGSMSDG